MTCSHPYTKRLAPGTFVCIECGNIVQQQSGKVYDTGPLTMPPVVYLMTEDYWKAKNPWPLMPFSIAKKYGWYGSTIYGREYLVMPVFKQGEGPVFYSARCLEPGCPKKYKYQTPENRQRVMWRSGPARKGRYVLLGEGIADAAYLSQLAVSCGLLGSHGEIADERIITILDGDVKGIESAFAIAQARRRKGLLDTKAVILPAGKDPTDFRLDDLTAIIYEQTGVIL